ncbi:MAG: phosphate ABC transporter permease subunit PstC [candidate division KSB1 bacterium]|nr:phosphate ABC transporter permease subunit PstC [candidate division KSB1 bacterium]
MGAEAGRQDQVFLALTALAAFLLLVLPVGIGFVLVLRSLPALKAFGVAFLARDSWDPVAGEFGALGSLYGTLVTSALAMVMAVPVSLAIGYYLAELAPPRLSRVVGTGVELLAAVPSIIYGMWGLFVLAPVLADHVQPTIQKIFGSFPLFAGPPMGIGIFTASVVLALMVVPFISSVARDVFSMVPSVLKESGYGLGATGWEVMRGITLRYGFAGIIGGCLLGLARALGETMAVTFVIGNRHAVSVSLFEPGNSISSALANEFTEATDPLYLSALMGLGLVLFVLTVLVQSVSQLWLRAVRKKMGGAH